MYKNLSNISPATSHYIPVPPFFGIKDFIKHSFLSYTFSKESTCKFPRWLLSVLNILIKRLGFEKSQSFKEGKYNSCFLHCMIVKRTRHYVNNSLKCNDNWQEEKLIFITFFITLLLTPIKKKRRKLSKKFSLFLIIIALIFCKMIFPFIFFTN